MEPTKGAWRVQATWTVGDQERSYQPVFVPTRDDADRMAADMAETLRHFPTLTILVDFDPAGEPTDFDKRPSQPYRSIILGGQPLPIEVCEVGTYRAGTDAIGVTPVDFDAFRRSSPPVIRGMFRFR